jgi:hypothetical protein
MQVLGVAAPNCPLYWPPSQQDEAIVDEPFHVDMQL